MLLAYPSPLALFYLFCGIYMYSLDFPSGSEGEDSACKAGDLRLMPGSGRSSGEGNGYSLQYSCLENPWIDEPGGLQSMGLQSQTRLSD